jgi:aryl-alcohol dehydrogenase-like predicted oxidoreductase
MEIFPTGRLGRRRFLHYAALAPLGLRVWLASGNARAAVEAVDKARAEASDWPTLPRRILGRTGFEAGRLVFGCGAALADRPRDALLQAAFDAGINVFDVGSSHFYNDAERHLAPFLARHRERVFLISKAMTGLEADADQPVSVPQAKAAAALWTERLDQSLRHLGVDHVDAYYVMAANNPSLVASDELGRALQRAREAGKTRFLGLSCHNNQQAVLEAAAAGGLFALAQIAVTPAGWYDLPTGGVAAGSPPMIELRPFLQRIRSAGIALIGMKAARVLAGRRWFGWSDPEAFDDFYDPAMLAHDLSPFQRSYAWVLSQGLDLVNADMASFEHLHANLVAAAVADNDAPAGS